MTECGTHWLMRTEDGHLKCVRKGCEHTQETIERAWSA